MSIKSALFGAAAKASDIEFWIYKLIKYCNKYYLKRIML